MSNLTTKTQVPNVNEFYDRDLLERAIPAFIHAKFGQVRDIPRGNSDVIKFRKYSRLLAATTALSEGVTPVGSALSITDISATVLQYGDFVTTTDKLMMETEDPLVMEANEVLGEQAADTIDILTRNVLNAGTAVHYPSTATTRGTVTSAMLVTDADLREVVRQLSNNNARPITEMVNASPNYDTSALRPSFIAFVHPDMAADLEQLTYWVPAEKYARYNDLMPEEIGSWNGRIRFLQTTNAKIFTGEGSGGIDVYSLVVIAKNAYGITRISSEALQSIVKPLGAGEDPLNQRATIGWKATFVAKILQQEWITRIEAAVANAG